MKPLRIPDVHDALPTSEQAISGAGRILLPVFELLDRAGIPHCVQHGYESFPQEVSSDVDCIIAPLLTPAQLYTLFARNLRGIGAEVVRMDGYRMVLAGRDADASRCFLTLDLTTDCEIDGLLLCPGTALLAARHRYHQFWVASAALEFACYFARTIAKGCLDARRAQRLQSLYLCDPAGAYAQLARLWSPQTQKLIVSAAMCGDWEGMRRDLPALQVELRKHAIARYPLGFLRCRVRRMIDRSRRLCWPEGLNVVLLGPDGAGKSSIIDLLPAMLKDVFARTVCLGFVPMFMLRLLHGAHRSTDRPHALPPRSALLSIVRAVLYWLPYYVLGYPLRWVAMARATLVLYDRHFVDVLVDPRRYRYGGPAWLLRLVWWLIPKPDLVILLDAPAEVLHARKREVALAETAQQRLAYRELVCSLPMGCVINTDRPLEDALAEVSEIILQHLAQRLERRHRAVHSRN
jgi:thymidylate kinase